MFERFTDRARRVVVVSQEEARGLNHNYIGAEHILLGLLEPGGVAAQALTRFGMTLTGTREEVRARVGAGHHAPGKKIPFTPRAKKVLELSLREALNLSHNYIGTEHIPLGLVREGEGVAAQILTEHAGDLTAVRQAVLDLLPPAQALPGRRWPRRRTEPLPGDEPGRAGETGEPGEPAGMPTTPAADAGLAEAARLAGSQPVGSHHLLLAALADPDSAAARTLTALGVNLDEAREALGHADIAGTSDEQPEERGRRHMAVRVTDGGLVLEVTDPALQALARAAADAVGDRAPEPGTIAGDLPFSDSLAQVWLALRDSLEDIRQRAASTSRDPGAGNQGEAGGPEKGRPAA
ncbi:MAG: Clp protease N-terminal domain-containing protein [Streptosporangiaceae bacterium]